VECFSVHGNGDRILVNKTEELGQLRKHERRLEDNIKMDFQCEIVNWIRIGPSNMVL
jgi:hypothetical protein